MNNERNHATTEIMFIYTHYLLSTDTKTVELVVSPTISIPEKDTLSLLRGRKMDSIGFTMTPEYIFDTSYPVREYQY